MYKYLNFVFPLHGHSCPLHVIEARDKLVKQPFLSALSFGASAAAASGLAAGAGSDSEAAAVVASSVGGASAVVSSGLVADSGVVAQPTARPATSISARENLRNKGIGLMIEGLKSRKGLKVCYGSSSSMPSLA